MDFGYDLLVLAHLLGMAAIVGGWLAVLRAPKVLPAQVWGARAQVVTGLAMVGLAESGAVTLDQPLDHAKVAVKLVVAIVVAGAAESLARRQRDVDPRAHAVGLGALLNVLVAVLWT
jgi:hypothetical protein